MKKRELLLTLFTATTVSLIATFFISTNKDLNAMDTKEIGAISSSVIGSTSISNIQDEIVKVSKKAAKSVAFIKVSKVVKSNFRRNMDPFWEFFFGPQNRRNNKQFNPKKEGLGTGFVVDDKKGYIVTNNHVIADADSIEVTINGKKFKAKLIGTDKKTDVGLLQIKNFKNGDIKQLEFESSEKVKVGSFAIAIGNPFGLDQTVTFGIVSAKGRAGVNLTEYEDFIQTDAAINPGNSGGPLLNIDGKVIGMNTAIFSKSGGYMGIGFAVPSHMVQSVISQLKTGNGVKRAQMGVIIQPLTPELKKYLGINEDKGGVIVNDIAEGSPAKNAKFKRGDVIIRFNGKDVDSVPKLRNIVAFSPTNKKIKVDVIRDKKQKSLYITLRNESDYHFGSSDKNFHSSDYGFTASINNNKVVIDKVKKDSLAAMSGLMKGDVVIEINRKKVNSLKSVKKAIKNSNAALFLIDRNRRMFYIAINK